MTITIEEAKAFIQDAVSTPSYKSWLQIADKSWGEIKKRDRNNNIYKPAPKGSRRKSRYPAWYSIWKIRQGLVFSRPGIPIGKDTTQDGNDNIGATAAICIERLAINLAKSFNFFEVICDVRDDFLATNFGTARGYYEREEVKEKVKERIQPQQIPNAQGGMDTVLADAQGNILEPDEVMQDDEGYFLEVDQTVDIINEKICLEHILYKHIKIDPDIRRWNRCRRVSFDTFFSEPEFKEIFGIKAFLELPSQKDGDDASKKRQGIKVHEYWDDYEKEAFWFAEDGSDFIKPKSYYVPEADDADYEDDADLNGIYNLEKFFPLVEPAIMNAPTDEFWPIPEYYQLTEIFEDIHQIFSRMVETTRAIRVLLLFDNNIDGLQSLINGASDRTAIGVPNLAQSLVASGGSLSNAAQYLPMEDLVNALGTFYQALEQRLNTVYKLTGTSDLLQGLITDPTQRTFGERQMTEKYALNQLAEPQAKMAKFARDAYQLLAEMALKNFNDASLDMYIMPQTLDGDHQSRYRAALGLLKDNQKRFRIELETDSTIALNEEFDKKMRLELVNALTAALEKTASTAQSSPALVVVELHAMKYLIQGYRQGKMFQNEITQAIDNVIKQAEAAAQKPAFNKDEAANQTKAQELQLKQQEIQATNQLKQYEIDSDERIEIAKLQQNERMASLESQMEQFKIQNENQNNQADRNIDIEKLRSEIFATEGDLQAKREALQVEIAKIDSAKEVEMLNFQSRERLSAYEMGLKESEQRLNEYRIYLDEQEKYATEVRLQSEHELQKLQSQLQMAAQIQDTLLKQKEAQSQLMETQRQSAPPPPSTKKRIKITRDENGNVQSYDIEGQSGYRVIRDMNGDVEGYEPLEPSNPLEGIKL